MEKRISDPDAVKAALSATGLTQVVFGRMIGENQSQVSRWANGATLSHWQHRIVVRMGKVSAESARLLPFLLSEDRIEDALMVGLGSSLPEVAE